MRRTFERERALTSARTAGCTRPIITPVRKETSFVIRVRGPTRSRATIFTFKLPRCEDDDGVCVHESSRVKLRASKRFNVRRTRHAKLTLCRAVGRLLSRGVRLNWSRRCFRVYEEEALLVH